MWARRASKPAFLFCFPRNVFCPIEDKFHLLSPRQPFSKRHILDFSKFKVFADDNFKFDENADKSSRRVENTVGKGKIAR